MGGGTGNKGGYKVGKNDDAEGMCTSVASLEPDPRYSGCCSNIFRPGRVVRDLVVGSLVVLAVAVVVAVVFVVCFFFVPTNSEGEAPLLGEESAFHGEPFEEEGPYKGINEVVLRNTTRYEVDPQLEKIREGEHGDHHHDHEGHDHHDHEGHDHHDHEGHDHEGHDHHDHEGHDHHDNEGHDHHHDHEGHDHQGHVGHDHHHDHEGHDHRDHEGHDHHHDHDGHEDHHHGHEAHHVGPVPEPEGESEPEPEAEPEPEPESEPEPEPDHHHGKGPVTQDHTHHEMDHDHTHDHDHAHPEMGHDHTQPEMDHDHAHDHGHAHDHDHPHGPDHTHDHDHPHELDHTHDHDHAQDHDHTHDHDQTHNHDHAQDNDHTHDHGHAQDNDHTHDHDHAQDNDHAHDHGHAQDSGHTHDHDHAQDHDHTHDHDHAQDNDHTHDHDHAHDHDHPHPTMDHDHSHNHEHAAVTHDHTHPEADHDHTHPEADHDHTHLPDGTVVPADPKLHHDHATHKAASLPPLFDLFTPQTPGKTEGTLEELVVPHEHASEDGAHPEPVPEETPGVNDEGVTEVPQGKCHPRQLEMCSDLPHALTAFPNWAGDETEEELHQTSLPFLRDVIVRSRCSPRAKEYSCAILEPPCTPDGSILPPCRTFCKSVAATCQEFITSRFSLSSAFDCEQFPDSSDPNVCFDMTSEPCLGLEHRCGDGRCVAKRLVCDGHSDCLDSSDEAVCPGQGSDSASGDNTTSVTSAPEEGEGTEPSLLETTTLPLEFETDNPACPELQCLDGSCISLSQVKDGVIDCPDGIDEEDFEGIL